MIDWDHVAERVRRGDPVSPALDLALRACTPAVRLGMVLRRLRPTVRLDARVISYGNITAGGTGKTPAVIARAQRQIDEGRRVAVLTRGYGSPAGTASADSTHLSENELYPALGDEAALIARKVPGAVVLKDADRVASGRRAITEHGCDTLILDDGFQYLRLAREENIVLIDATNPFGNGHLIPRGILREPLTALHRATEVVITRADLTNDLSGLSEHLTKLLPNTPIRATRHAPVGFRRAADGDAVPLNEIEGRGIAVACAIGNPESFVRTLEHLGASVVETRAFRDHRDFSTTDLPTDVPVVITEKDWVRSRFTQDNVLVLEIALQDWPISGEP